MGLGELPLRCREFAARLSGRYGPRRLRHGNAQNPAHRQHLARRPALCALRRSEPVGLVDPQFMRRRIFGRTGRKCAGAFLPGAPARTGDRQMMRGILSAICFAAALAASPALAQDEGRGVGYVATGPIFDLPSGMSVERLEVHISIYSVRLAYVFKSSKRQSVHFSFALPEMPVDAGPDIVGLDAGDEAAGFTADIEPFNYMNLSVQVNGRKLALGGHGRALHKGKDVTRRLLDAGVPLLYDPAGDAPWPKLPPEVQEKLRADGL